MFKLFVLSSNYLRVNPVTFSLTSGQKTGMYNQHVNRGRTEIIKYNWLNQKRKRKETKSINISNKKRIRKQ